jgi:hypothetical protein
VKQDLNPMSLGWELNWISKAQEKMMVVFRGKEEGKKS